MKNRLKLILTGAGIIMFVAASHAEPPETPKLYVSTNGPQVNLYWDEVSGADKYTLIASNLNDGSLFGQFDLGANTRVTTPFARGIGFFCFNSRGECRRK